MSYTVATLMIQRRVDDSEDLNRNWADYEMGFGSLTGEQCFGLVKDSGKYISRFLVESPRLRKVELILVSSKMMTTKSYNDFNDLSNFHPEKHP